MPRKAISWGVAYQKISQFDLGVWTVGGWGASDFDGRASSISSTSVLLLLHLLPWLPLFHSFPVPTYFCLHQHFEMPTSINNQSPYKVKCIYLLQSQHSQKDIAHWRIFTTKFVLRHRYPPIAWFHRCSKIMWSRISDFYSLQKCRKYKMLLDQRFSNPLQVKPLGHPRIFHSQRFGLLRGCCRFWSHFYSGNFVYMA